jgi:hypothetical protein
MSIKCWDCAINSHGHYTARQCVSCQEYCLCIRDSSDFILWIRQYHGVPPIRSNHRLFHKRQGSSETGTTYLVEGLCIQSNLRSFWRTVWSGHGAGDAVDISPLQHFVAIGLCPSPHIILYGGIWTRS